MFDISKKAIEKEPGKDWRRKGFKVHWIVSDVTEFIPDVLLDFWHDRAVFHFITTEENIYKYGAIGEDAIRKDGYLIPGTFSESQIVAA